MAAPSFFGGVSSLPWTIQYSATLPAGATIDGLGDIAIKWKIPLIFSKDLNKAYPAILYGALEGDITIQGFRGALATTMDAQGLNSMSVSTVNVVVQGVTFSGYATGPGFKGRQIAPRVWTLDKTQTFKMFG